MTETAFTLGAGGLEVIREVARLPKWPVGGSADELMGLREEARLRDDLFVYGHAFDALDLDAVMGYFADDVAITNPRGRYEGIDIVRRNYQFLFEQWPHMRHVWANVIVRFPDSIDEAYRSSYFYSLLSSPTRSFAAAGTDVHRLRRIDGHWKIVQRAITDDLSHTITVFGDQLEEDPGF